MAYYAALLAQWYGQGVQRIEGLCLLTEALAVTGHSETHWWSAGIEEAKALLEGSGGQCEGDDPRIHHAGSFLSCLS